MLELQFSPRAQHDLGEVVRYIGQDSREIAARYVHQLKSKCRTLAEFPQLGRSRDDLSPGLRSFPIESYVVYYRTLDFGVRIERVLHGAMEVSGIDFE